MVTAWRNRIVGQGEEAPDQLVANPLNWRTHPGSQRDALRGSLATVGWVQQVLVNRQTGNVVDGHARVEEALSRGEKKVPVLYIDLDPDEERLVLASLDPIGAMAVADNQKLEELLADLQSGDEGLDALLRELAPAKKVVGLTDPDDAPDLGEETHIKRGDIFALGDHRVMCGDSTKAEDVAGLTSGPVDIVWTDPPYGVDYRGGSRPRSAIENDREIDVVEVLAPALRLAPLRPGGAFYIAGPDGTLFLDALREVGWRLRQQLVWVKDTSTFGRSDYQWRHESLLYGWMDGAAHHWSGGRKQDTVWEIPRPKRSESHPTMKPVELVERSIQNSSKRGERVYDPFLGSGTTVIAAEQTERRCYGMEIDPRYVAVTIARWENFTGREAERL